MSVKERVNEFLNYLNISAREFCRNIGVSETYIGSMRKSFQPDKLKNIAVHYPNLNIAWLMTGEGEMINEPNDNLLFDRKSEYISGRKFRIENEKCPTCERLKWKVEDLNKENSELKKENSKLLEDNAVLRYLLDGKIDTG